MSPTFLGGWAINVSLYIYAVVANITGWWRRAWDTGGWVVHQRHLCGRALRRSTYIFDVESASRSWDVAITRDIQTRRQISASRFSQHNTKAVNNTKIYPSKFITKFL